MSLFEDPGEALDRYRALRQRLEESALALASSVDGRRFSFQASMHELKLQAGGYVVLGEREHLAQILSVELAQVEGPDLAFRGPGDVAQGSGRMILRIARGEGVVLSSDGAPFHDAEVRPASSPQLAAWLESVAPERAALEVGELLLAPGVPARLDAGGFARHSFLCGQSGSGKTYSLGLILEQLVLKTDLRIVVLDPNSDYVRLAETRADGHGGLAAEYAAAASDIVVHRGADLTDRDTRLRLRFSELDQSAQAAVLRLDPIADRDEYAELIPLVESSRMELVDLGELARDGNEQARALVVRAQNLGLDRWEVWGRAEPGSLVAELEAGSSRRVIVDLGSLATRSEQELVAEATLATLWRMRERREPVLIVIDEGHNVCPGDPQSALGALATEHAVRIAAEGRKFGLYLFIATQRPQKVHLEVLSQCDNVVLLRMNSPADLQFLGEALSFVPRGLTERASAFRQGEALVAGKISSHPALLRFGRRISQEGGADVAADWARPRP